MAAIADQSQQRVEVNPTDTKQFSLTVFGPDGKKKAKHYFKTSTPEEMRLWIKAINAFTGNIKEDKIEQAASSFGSKGKKSRSSKASFTVSTKRESPFQSQSNEDLFKAF